MLYKGTYVLNCSLVHFPLRSTNSFVIISSDLLSQTMSLNVLIEIFFIIQMVFQFYFLI